MEFYKGFKQEFNDIVKYTQDQFDITLPSHRVIIGDELYREQEDSRVAGFIRCDTHARYHPEDDVFMFKHFVTNFPDRAACIKIHEVAHMVHKYFGANQLERSPVEKMIDEGFSDWFMVEGFKGRIIAPGYEGRRVQLREQGIKDAYKHLAQKGTSSYDINHPYDHGVPYNVGLLFFTKAIEQGLQPIDILRDPPRNFEQIDSFLSKS